MARGTPRITVRLGPEDRERVQIYREKHALPDFSAALRAMLQEEAVAFETEDVLAWLAEAPALTFNEKTRLKKLVAAL
jgi:hypothetical protein